MQRHAERAITDSLLGAYFAFYRGQLQEERARTRRSAAAAASFARADATKESRAQACRYSVEFCGVCLYECG